MIEIEIKADSWINAPGYKKQILADSDILAGKGVYTQVVVIEPGSTVLSHYHKKTYEFYYVIEGDVAFTINDYTRRLKKGEMLITEPNDIHRVENDRADPFTVLVFKTNAVRDDTFWI